MAGIVNSWFYTKQDFSRITPNLNYRESITINDLKYCEIYNTSYLELYNN